MLYRGKTPARESFRVRRHFGNRKESKVGKSRGITTPIGVPTGARSSGKKPGTPPRRGNPTQPGMNEKEGGSVLRGKEV